MTRALGPAVVAAALVAALARPADDPHLLDAAVVLGHLRSALVASAWIAAAWLSGRGALRRLAPGLTEDPLSWLHSMVLGLLVWSAGVGALAVAGALRAGPLLGLGVGMGLAGLIFGRGPVTAPRVAPAGGAERAILGLAAAFGVVQALAPPADTDELYQHLALPARMLREGGLIGGPLHADGSRPMGLHLIWASLSALGGDRAARLATAAAGVAVLEATRGCMARAGAEPAARGVVLLAILGSQAFTQELGLAANNLPTALAVLAAYAAAGQGSAVGLGAAAGVALTFKYTAAGPLLGVGVGALAGGVRGPSAAVALAVLVVAPWWIRNIADGLHPLFPYAGWERLPGAPTEGLRFAFLDKYGAGRAPGDLLALPWRAVMTGDPESFRFLGRLNPAWIPVGIAALAAPGSGGGRALAAGVVGAVAWAAGPHWLRHLLPTLPLIAIAGACGLQTLAPRPGPQRRALIGGCAVALLSGAAANGLPLLARLADRAPAAAGREDATTFYSRHLPAHEAVAWANQHLPEDARVALLFDWSSALIDRPTLLGSVEDHVPTRSWLLRHGDAALPALREAGATHLIVGRAGFLRKQYPMLSDERFHAELVLPAEQLEDQLSQHAELLYEARHTRVFRLRDAPPWTPPRAPPAGP